MKTLKRFYDWCLVKCRRILGAITEFLPSLNMLSKEKISWFGKKARRFLLRLILVLSVFLFMSPIISRVGGGSSSGLPIYTFSGSSSLVDEGNKNWHIDFYSSGDFVLLSGTINIDAYILGGGGGGARQSGNVAGGGGGGYTHNVTVSLVRNTVYSIVVGAGGAGGSGVQADGSNGGTSSAFGTSSLGGYGGRCYVGDGVGGNGGSGGGGGSTSSSAYAGNGGSNGSNGTAGTKSGGYGQGTTTRKFGDADGDLLGAGGGGGNTNNLNGTGGATGGGNGGGSNGTINTGGGGGGKSTAGSDIAGTGGSGLVSVRNHRAAA